MYILGINGPPRSGKDTLAQMIVEHMESQRATTPHQVRPLSHVLRAITYSMTGWHGELTGDNYERFKITKFPSFGGRDGRQLMIDVSESFLKPMYGSQAISRILIESLKDYPGLVIIPDFGFQVEAGAINDTVGADNLYTVRIHSAKRNFNHDSREYVYTTHDTDILNNGSLKDLRTEAARIYGRLVNQMQWKL